MDFSRLPSYPDASRARAPWWWRTPRPDERDWFTTGMKALFVVGTLVSTFYLRSMILAPQESLGAAINAANYDRIEIGMPESEVEKLFGVPGAPVADPAWPREPGEQWVKWADPNAKERWIAVALRTWERHGEPLWTLVVAKKKNGF